MNRKAKYSKCDWMPGIISTSVVSMYFYVLLWVTFHAASPHLESIIERLNDLKDLMLLVIGYWLRVPIQKLKERNLSE